MTLRIMLAFIYDDLSKLMRYKNCVVPMYHAAWSMQYAACAWSMEQTIEFPSDRIQHAHGTIVVPRCSIANPQALQLVSLIYSLSALYEDARAQSQN
jgi:hypothetical protein